MLEQVAEPGAFFTCRAGDVADRRRPRSRPESSARFVNVCRHRGHEVAQGCGRRETLQCPYHAWTYDLDGSLRAAPRSDREPGFDHSDWSLLPVLVDTWGPLVFVNPDLDARAARRDARRATAARWPSAASTRPCSTYRGRSREWVVEANWKIVVENFLECYHCPVAHKSFSQLIDVDPDAYRLTTGRWTSSQYGPVQEPRGGARSPTTRSARSARASSTTSGRTGR